MKETKLEIGEIYQKKGTLDVRTVYYVGLQTTYSDIGGAKEVIYTDSFRRWLRRNDVELIGHYDFDKKKARGV